MRRPSNVLQKEIQAMSNTRRPKNGVIFYKTNVNIKMTTSVFKKWCCIVRNNKKWKWNLYKSTSVFTKTNVEVYLQHQFWLKIDVDLYYPTSISPIAGYFHLARIILFNLLYGKGRFGDWRCNLVHDPFFSKSYLIPFYNFGEGNISLCHISDKQSCLSFLWFEKNSRCTSVHDFVPDSVNQGC